MIRCSISSKHRCISEPAENPNAGKPYTPVEPTLKNSGVGLTGARKNFSAEKIFSPRSMKKSMIERANYVQTSPNFVDTITRDL